MMIAPIVEGHGEVEAVPILLRRLAANAGIFDLMVNPPIRRPRTKIFRKRGIDEKELRSVVALAVKKVSRGGAVFFLMDAHNDCPAEIAPRLVEMVRREHGDLRFAAVLAKKEYEAWFLGAIRSLRGSRGIKADAEPPEDPEAIRDAKRYLEAQMDEGTTYSETVDQPALTASFDIEEAKRACPSFDKAVRDLARLLTA